MVDQVAIVRSMGGLVFDAVFEETHESDLEVTDNPVETGLVVSDHAYMKPLRARISAGVSDTPLRGRQTSDQFAPLSPEEARLIREALVDTGVQLKNSFLYDSRSRRAFEMLQSLQARAEPFTVVTGLRLYKNMVCTSIRASQDKDSSAALLFTAELREVITVSTETVEYKVLNPAPGETAMQAKPIRDSGEQQIKEVTKNKESLLYAGKRIFTGAK